jgi:hypothetical protein
MGKIVLPVYLLALWTMFVLEIVKIGFPRAKFGKLIAFKIMKARQ